MIVTCVRVLASRSGGHSPSLRFTAAAVRPCGCTSLAAGGSNKPPIAVAGLCLVLYSSALLCTMASEAAPSEASIREECANAAHGGHFDKVIDLARSHPSLDLCNNERPGGRSGYTSMHQAAFWNVSVEVMTDLVALGGDVTRKTRDGETAAQIAHDKGHAALAAWLEAKAPMPEHTARARAADLAYRGDWDALLELCGAYPAYSLANNKRPGGSSGYTSLHQAAFNGAPVKVVEALLAAGGDPTYVTTDGKTPGDIAAEKGHNVVAHRLDEALRSASNDPGEAATDSKGKEDAAVGSGSGSGGGLWGYGAPGALPSSSKWSEARKRVAAQDLDVAYGGGVAHVREGQLYYVDSRGWILVGWHGTTSPPCGMDGESML